MAIRLGREGSIPSMAFTLGWGASLLVVVADVEFEGVGVAVVAVDAA